MTFELHFHHLPISKSHVQPRWREIAYFNTASAFISSSCELESRLQGIEFRDQEAWVQYILNEDSNFMHDPKLILSTRTSYEVKYLTGSIYVWTVPRCPFLSVEILCSTICLKSTCALVPSFTIVRIRSQSMGRLTMNWTRYWCKKIVKIPKKI